MDHTIGVDKEFVVVELFLQRKGSPTVWQVVFVFENGVHSHVYDMREIKSNLLIKRLPVKKYIAAYPDGSVVEENYP